MITISFGVSNRVERDASNYPTVGTVLNDANLQQFLGFGNNVEARVNDMTADVSQNLRDGDRIDLVTRQNKKG